MFTPTVPDWTRPRQTYDETGSVISSDNDDDSYGTKKQVLPQVHWEEIEAESQSRRRSIAESEFEYPETKQRILVMVAILLAVFLMALDITIIATAIPQITNEFHSLNDIGWYGSAFSLTACAFQLILGRVYTFCSPKYTFLAVILIFEVGSVICGAAPNSVTFIIGRAIAGVGSAGIMNGGIILMVSIVPLASRPAYQGFVGATFGLGSVIGPLLGGVFTTAISWRWCFYINLPIGAVAALVIVLVLKPTPPAQEGLTLREKLIQLDLFGQFFLLPSIICLLLALQWGGSTHPWNSARIIALLILSPASLTAFILIQLLTPQTATIPARVIANRSIIAGMWLVTCIASTMLIFVYYMPLWFQAIKSTSALQSGINTIPFVFSLVVGSIIAGFVVGKMGYYTPFAIAASIIMPVGAGLIATWHIATPAATWIGYQIVLGLGIGFGMQQGPLAAQTVLERKDVPTGVSLMFFCQQLGGAVFLSVGQNIFKQELVRGIVARIGAVDFGSVVNMGATELHDIVPEEQLEGLLVMFNLALRRVFFVGVCVAALSTLGAFGLEWRSVKETQTSSQNGENPENQSEGEKA